MSFVYLLDQNATVSKEGNRLLIKKEGKVQHTLHTFKIDQVILFGNIFLTPAVVRHLLYLGIDTVFMTMRGKYLGRLQSPYGKNIVLRRCQFRKADERKFCVKTAKAIVRGKLANLRAVLLRLNRTRENLELENQILGIRNLMNKVDDALSIDTLRGYEGKGSAFYFEGYAKGFISDEVSFKQRIRRPPPDPVNSLLGLGYTLLLNAVMSAVNMVGFDPFLGYFHSEEYGRPSLALDLMEEWRPIIVDTLILSLFNLKAIGPSDFKNEPLIEDMEDSAITDKIGEQGSGALSHVEHKDSTEIAEPGRKDKMRSRTILTQEGFRKFITQFERKISQKVQYHLTGQHLSYRDCMREQARHFARYIRGEEEDYSPMPLR